MPHLVPLCRGLLFVGFCLLGKQNAGWAFTGRKPGSIPAATMDRQFHEMAGERAPLSASSLSPN
jgi:hypothetical protein